MFKKVSLLAVGCLMLGGLASCGGTTTVEPSIDTAPVPEYVYDFIGLIGDAVGGWGDTDDKGFTVVEGDTELRTQTLTIELAAAEGKQSTQSFKIRANHKWDSSINKGCTMFDAGSRKYLIDEQRENLEAGTADYDPNAELKEAGTYKFTYHPYFFLEEGLTGSVTLEKIEA